MTTPDAESTDVAGGVASVISKPADPELRPPEAHKGVKGRSIQVSPVVLNAAQKNSEELLQELRTGPAGLTQVEAEDRARATGPNEIAQEKAQGWPIRMLKIMRNPLVILLGALSAISFATGDARAGTVMAMMVALSVSLRFIAGSPGGRSGGEAQGHDPRDGDSRPRRPG